jgi:hypothetical protein
MISTYEAQPLYGQTTYPAFGTTTRVLEDVRKKKTWTTWTISSTTTMKRRAMATWTKKRERNEEGNVDGW